MNTINLGDIARDSITGFVGVVVAETRWLHGCRHLTIQARWLHDDKPIEPQTFDEPQCILETKREELLPIAKTGGPGPEPRRQADPR